MSEPSSSPAISRICAAGEWLLALGLAATVAWTALCLGGYRPETMVVTTQAVLGLATLGGCLLVLHPQRLNPAVLLPVPFVLFALASAFWIAPARWLAWREWLLVLQTWLVFALALHFVRSWAQTWVLVGTFVVLGLVGAGLAAYQRFLNPEWLMLGRTQAGQFIGRSAGMFGIPNSLAGLLELMIPVSLALLWSRAVSVTGKIMCAWLALVWLAAMVLTISRGGWIALILALALWPLLSGGDWRKKLAGAGAVLALAAITVVVLYHFSDYAHGRIVPFLTGEFEVTRPVMWRVALQIWRQQPWLGGGAASYNVLFDRHRPLGFDTEPVWAHNDYLNTLSDYGAVGFLLWLAAGVAILWLGWGVVRTARRTPAAGGGFFALWRWKFGLWLGLVAYALHLTVDFHTKIPALAFAAAISAGLLLRQEKTDGGTVARRMVPLAVGLAAGLLLPLVAWRAYPLCRAEALRYGWRQDLNKAQNNPLARDQVIPPAIRSFESAVKTDPSNAQAWADLAYATELSWLVTHGNLAATGRRAEAAAEQALRLCPLMAEFWVRKGVALDMQARQQESEPCFLRALELAPHSPQWRYLYAYHLSGIPHRKAEALAAVEICLALDPGFPGAVALRERLRASR
jgi:O-antigen ligase